jgi:hypothetical protein
MFNFRLWNWCRISQPSTVSTWYFQWLTWWSTVRSQVGIQNWDRGDVRGWQIWGVRQPTTSMATSHGMWRPAPCALNGPSSWRTGRHPRCTAAQRPQENVLGIPGRSYPWKWLPTACHPAEGMFHPKNTGCIFFRQEAFFRFTWERLGGEPSKHIGFISDLPSLISGQTFLRATVPNKN